MDDQDDHSQLFRPALESPMRASGTQEESKGEDHDMQDHPQRVMLSRDERRESAPRYDRVFKSFKIEPFSGSVNPGAFDSRAAAWFESFTLQLSMEEDMHGIYLNEAAKNALFYRSLCGVAREWYIANKDDFRRRTLANLGHSLKQEFGNRLTKLQICEMVANERKRPEETYHQFSLRLRAMAAATTSDGTESTESNNLALSGFLSNAWRRHTDALRLIIREDSRDPLYEMNRAIKRLCMLAKHQGILPPRSKQLTSLGKHKNSDTDKPHDRATKAGKRNTSSKPGKIYRKDYSKARCGECGEYGHTTGYHDTFVLRSKRAAPAASSITARPYPALPRSDSEDDEKITSARCEESA